MHYLYLISTENNETKIGITYDVEKRFKVIQASNPQKLKLKVIIEYPDESSAKRVEGALHKYFEPQNIHYEWFKVSAKQVLRLMKLASIIGNAPISVTIVNSKSAIESNATDKAYQWLMDNPDSQDKNLRELAEIIGVGKDSVAKAKKRLSENIQ